MTIKTTKRDSKTLVVNNKETRKPHARVLIAFLQDTLKDVLKPYENSYWSKDVKDSLLNQMTGHYNVFLGHSINDS